MLFSKLFALACVAITRLSTVHWISQNYLARNANNIIPVFIAQWISPYADTKPTSVRNKLEYKSSCSCAKCWQKARHKVLFSTWKFLENLVLRLGLHTHQLAHSHAFPTWEWEVTKCSSNPKKHNQQNCSAVLLLIQLKNCDLELSDVACRLSINIYKAAAKRMNTKHYPNRMLLIASPSPTQQN